MADKIFPQSGVPIRKTSELLPQVFKTPANEKFTAAILDPLVQPGVLQKTVGYIGRRYGKTYKGTDVYLDNDATLRSRYQLEPGVVIKKDNKVSKFYDYIDFKNQLRFFGNYEEQDYKITDQEHYSWDPPINWDKFTNYREYYWIPEGPPDVFVQGQAQNITSTYRVKLGANSSWIFYPDGLTNNPTITLYRGQTYKFRVTAPDETFTIRSVYDTGSLLYNPLLPYSENQLALFDNKIWRAKKFIPQGDGSTITTESEDWEFVEAASTASVLDYNEGIEGNNVEDGLLTFNVPLDAPDVLFYQSSTNLNRLGRFIIADVESNTKIDIEKEIIGKKTYTSSNEIEFSNGLKIVFTGNVFPEKYSRDSWIVEGVGESITLVRYQDLVISSSLNISTPDIVFDGAGFDTDPFDDASSYPARKDYITINRSSPDLNPWSRYNRWFHKSVLENAHKINNSSFESLEARRAKRPIIEFKSGIQLFNHGSIAKQTVDYLDDFTLDVFSNIEGSAGYNVDGEQLFDGARILVTADTDSLANNRIYEVKFIVHNNRRQISLIETEDSESIIDQGVLIRRGNKNQGLMYHFNGIQWVSSQKKINVNQPPLFDVFDQDGISLSDLEKYPISTFKGNEVISYKVGNGPVDSELGFSLSYLNIDNVGDIEFEFDWDIELVNYQILELLSNRSKTVNSGFLKINPNETFENCWIKTDKKYIQPIIDSKIIEEETQEVLFNSIIWNSDSLFELAIYINGERYTGNYERYEFRIAIEDRVLVKGDVVTIKIFGDVRPDRGYYEIPVSLERNPLNQDLINFTYGMAVDHVSSAVEFDEEFEGAFPGPSNLRDIQSFRNKSKRFLKHSGIPSLSIALLCDKQTNIIKALQFSKKSYSDFKNNFIELATALYYNQNPSEFVDEILAEISKTKSSITPFYASDMIGNGAYTPINYTVEDEGIKTFALSEKFDLVSLSQRAVYVYLNELQLLVDRDYEFNSVFGFITLKIDLSEGDQIQIREYVSTAFNFIPPTPTKLGLYKKYTPTKFIDDTYAEPREVIQGHDGSITTAYGDFRDDVILELEYRIYNNIKQTYQESIFDIDSVIGSYYGNGLYNKQQLDAIVIREFLKWSLNTGIDYTNNSFFESENPFTYTYSRMSDPTKTQNLPGYWRGVYKWFYDTDRPHRCPWEMLGFSEQPDWWEAEYGPAPYTSNNLLLWEDLRDGIIRQGSKAGTYDRYKRPSILSHIPVDGDGNLLNPLDSNLAKDFVLVSSQGSFKLGDVSPAEYAWRSSSEWPFAVVLAMCLMKPFEFITDLLDKSKVSTNKLDQTVSLNSGKFLTISDLIETVSDDSQTAGLINYLKDYIKGRSQSLSDLKDLFSNIDINLSSRISGFVDQEQQKYLLDSKNPRASSGSIFVPPENYDIIFNVSCPIQTLNYSGIVFEKVERGWEITGYDNIEPYFYYYPAVTSQTDPLMRVGGVSENFVEWTPDRFYGNGVIVRFRNDFYRSITSHTAQSDFDSTVWRKLPSLPLIGGIEAFKRKNFNEIKLSRLEYGTVLTSIQAVVDFLLGYEVYLKRIGFSFDDYDATTQTAKDWTTAAKEFMFWTKQNWEVGSLLTVSPSANKVSIANFVGVADNFLDSFYDYEIYKSDGTPLAPDFINVERDFQNLSVSTIDTNDGIYYLKIYYVLKEHVVIFTDRTVFNDVIYDKSTGYRQERIKTRGFRTTDWDGDYTSPGFIFDNVSIDPWQPFVDYRLGDIITYKSYNWVSQRNQSGTEEFQVQNWSKLDSSPSKKLVPNFDYRINQFDDYFDLDSDGLGTSQRTLARHAIGYQKRTYLENLAEDDISQYKIYQGFIREKGTANSVIKVFDKLSRSQDTSISLNEEWAFRLSRYGGTDQLSEFEFRIYNNELQINPQPILIESSKRAGAIVDQYLRADQTEFTIFPKPFSVNINPLIKNDYESRSAGYVKLDHIEFIVKDRQSLLNLDINSVRENNHIWITFDGPSWSVWRFNESTLLYILNLEKTQGTATITFNRSHEFSIGDIVGLKDIENLEGFFEVIDITSRTIDINVPSNLPEPNLDPGTVTKINVLTPARFKSYENVIPRNLALLNTGSRLWIDDNGENNWEVIEKKQNYNLKELLDFGISDPLQTGYAVIYSDLLKQTFAGMPRSGFVISYIENTQGISPKHIISSPSGLTGAVNNSFGMSLALSPDSKYLVVGSPMASGVPSSYMDKFDPLATYLAGEIVLYQGRLWKAKDDVFGDGSSINLYSQDWELVDIIEANPAGRADGYSNQGMISIFEWSDQQWNYSQSFISPRPNNDEEFGHSVTIGKTGSTYYMAVSAPGAVNDRGRVYLYVKENGSWKHLENINYKGVYDGTQTDFYPKGSIVWESGNFWEALEDNANDGSSLSVDSNDWKLLDPVTTTNSLPKNVSLDDDGSTLTSGILDSDQISALTKIGDRFGHSLAMTKDGSTLVVGAPDSDAQYFANYKGDWVSYQEYTAGDVVRTDGNYYRLIDIRGDGPSVDSTVEYTVVGGDRPGDADEPWISVGDSTSPITGKIYIYRRDQFNRYLLSQTIAAENFDEINDLDPNEIISSGDNFGYSIDIDASGTTLVTSSPQADINGQNQGSVYIFRKIVLSNEFRLKQKIESYETQTNEFFGSSVSISSGTEKIVVGARNASFKAPIRFDSVDGTEFDDSKTSFYDSKGYPGQVYVFERKDQIYYLAEKLQADFSENESFGFSVDCTTDIVIVGSPRFEQNDLQTGNVRLYRQTLDKDSLEIIGQEQPVVDIRKLKNISYYDDIKSLKVADADIVDHYKFKILGVAEQELKFKSLYDPAVYNIGTENQFVDQDLTWYEKHAGQLWWDLSTVKWIYYEQGDAAYRSGNWNRLAEGASIDIYEWVESPLLPSEWAVIADTVEGLAANISGQPLYPDDTVYSVKEILNPGTGLPNGTLYYYWVKNKRIAPNISGRRISAADVAALIFNPAALGTPVIALIDSDKILGYNLSSAIISDSLLINIQYIKKNVSPNLIHSEYQLLTEGVADSVPTASLETKWIDSLIGFDNAGNSVPDPALSEKQKYGISYRPRQSMFVDRIGALTVTINRVNKILRTKPFTDILDFRTLNLVDSIPSFELNEYDVEVDNYIDLEQVGTVRIRQAILSANIVDGRIDTIDIIDPGFGYRVTPTVDIQGTGTGARAQLTLDNQGRVSSITVTNKGRKYSTATVLVRPFSVLVNSDETSKGFWTVYSWDQQRRIFFRSRSQGFDTSKYWEYVNYWKEGYSQNSRIVQEISNFYLEPTTSARTGDLIRIKEFANGGWAVLEKTEDGQGDLLGKYILVGRENGTIQIKSEVYDPAIGSIGYDNLASFDINLYDLQPIKELRNIFKAVKEDIFIDDLRAEWNNLFFVAIRYVFAEQIYVDWAFKTSFLQAIHTVGDLEQKINYRSDNLDSYKEYLEEVKPYRTTIREYTSRYTELQETDTAVTDFDLPPAYSSEEGLILPVNEFYNRFNEYPWKWWADNIGYEIVSIEISDGGEGYTSPPNVLIQGNGTGAEAIAYVVNGSVSGIKVTNFGSGYISAPTVSLVGGNGFGNRTAKAVPILGNGKSRSMSLIMKFDRLSKFGIYNQLTSTQTIVSPGNRAAFDLIYAPTLDKSTISIKINGQTILNSDYSISLYRSNTDTYGLLKGRLILNSLPAAGDIIEIEYEKNDQLLDSVNRIEKFYSPTSGMKGKEFNQLMTGIDFGGVQIQGTTFDITGGWDALPWFTDAWDSVESNSDFYVVVDGSTTDVELPEAPESGEIITIYLKRVNEDKAIRIDDLYFNDYDGSTLQPNGRKEASKNALLPSFVGNGVNKKIEISDYFSTDPGDTIIFRKVTSDGSVTINDVNIIDTRLSGGTLEKIAEEILIAPNTIEGMYTTARGITAEELTVDGGKFISPEHVPSTEENVPGQVLDSFSIKVYTSSLTGAAPIQVKVIPSDGVTTSYDIGLRVFEKNSIIVFVDKIKQTYQGPSSDYSIDFVNNQIQFTSAPVAQKLIEIISIGVGGVEILDYQEFIADGDTTLFLTRASYDQTQSVYVTVDGEQVDVGFVDSSDILDVKNRTLVQFGIKPEELQVIKVISLGAALDTDSGGQSFVRVNNQTFFYDGSTKRFELDRFVNLSRGSSQASILVELNGTQLKNVDTSYQIYDGSNNTVIVGLDPDEAFGTITSGSIRVFLNNLQLRFVIDYTFDGNQNKIIINSSLLNVGDEIKIETDVRVDYSISNNDLIISEDVVLSDGDRIDITWFGEYPTMNIVSDQHTGGKLQYKLSRIPLSVSYIWIYKNGQRLTQDQDYYVSIPRRSVYLSVETTVADEIKIVQYSGNVYNFTSAYEISKDMLNGVYYKRYSENEVKLSKDLYYYDQQIEVTDGGLLTDPIRNRNIPGIVYINGERIEYLQKAGNTLSQLRRGSYGTPISEKYDSGTGVIDLGFTQTVPYNEGQDQIDFVSDGSSILIGPLPFVPQKSTRNSWTRESIPENYGPCDQIEVFVGGRRLRKNPIEVYNEMLGASSPSADTAIEAEFSVDGISSFVRITDAVAIGTKISVIRKTGQVWYDRGENSITSGQSLTKNSNTIAKFITEKTTQLPE